MLLYDKAKRRLSLRRKTNHEFVALYYDHLKVILPTRGTSPGSVPAGMRHPEPTIDSMLLIIGTHSAQYAGEI